MSELRTVLEKYPDYEAVIGMEVHVQLTTKSKIFCLCKNESGGQPNKNICNICCGYPGVLPLLNKQVVNYAMMAGLATNCSLTRRSQFDRKHYFYPDLPKAYQITQQYNPICKEGHITIRLEDNSTKKIKINRIHMEEDAGKSIHSSYGDASYVDLNRAGTPLLEIVSEPDLSSSFEVRAYLKELHRIVRYLQICTGNMEEGAFRADTNISVRKKGDRELGTKCELKNINSFKFIADATEYEIARQIELLKKGERVVSQTRLWDSKKKETVIMRNKEEVADYRFFPDPDLPVIEINDEWIERMKKVIPELPQKKFVRLCIQKGLTPAEAEILIDDPELAQYFERVSELTPSKSVINWVLRDIMGYLKEHKIGLIECLVTPEKLAKLVDLVEQGKINSKVAKEVFLLVAQKGEDPEEIVVQKGLEQIDSVELLEPIIKEIVSAHPNQVEQFKAGKDRLFGFFVGKVMQQTKGRANPNLIQKLLKEYLRK